MHTVARGTAKPPFITVYYSTIGIMWGMLSQHWRRWWLCVVRQQNITFIHVNQDNRRKMGLSYLKKKTQQISHLNSSKPRNASMRQRPRVSPVHVTSACSLPCDYHNQWRYVVKGDEAIFQWYTSTITWDNADPNSCRRMASLSHNDLALGNKLRSTYGQKTMIFIQDKIQLNVLC